MSDHHKRVSRPTGLRLLFIGGVCATLVTLLVAVPSRVSAQFGPASEPLNLFQLIARSELVAHVKVRNGSLKYALVDLIESMKGHAPGEHLRIAFRDFNFTRRPGEESIVFPDGQQEILFLVPYKIPRKKKDIEKYKDLFTLYQGRRGRLTVPAEGPEIVLEAIRRLAQVSTLDASSQVEALRGLLGSPNPFLLEASLTEIERLRAADASLFPRLASLLRSPAPTLRGTTLRVMGQVFGTAGTSADGFTEEARAALAAVMERARNDAVEAVRVQAVAALGAWPIRGDVEGELRAIAGTDQAQAVRYEAQRALFRP